MSDLPDLDKIERLALPARNPTSAVNGTQGWPGAGDFEEALKLLLGWPEPVADYIAAMSPDVVLALVRRIRKLEAEKHSYEAERDDLRERLGIEDWDED